MIFFSFFSVVKTVEDDKTEEDFREVMRQINVKEEEILVVGDRIKKEIVIGNKIGLKTVWLKKGLYATELPKCCVA
ncbi:HAD hydrolase-like protein [Candidatus Woesearchaeota archaeon]|nr:HAD hydrolase-like protein [Candidatus Woesearchaeota archaeon]